jgi:hypothetical protein
MLTATASIAALQQVDPLALAEIGSYLARLQRTVPLAKALGRISELVVWTDRASMERRRNRSLSGERRWIAVVVRGWRPVWRGSVGPAL